MNYLQLVQRLALESGAELQARITSVTTTPANAYGQTTEHINRLVTWIQQAWLEIQMDQDTPGWKFLRERTTIDLEEGQTSYNIALAVQTAEGSDLYDGIVPFVAPVARRYVWVFDSDVTPFNKQPCFYVPPEHFFGHVDRTAQKGQPTQYSFDPDGCIVLDQGPPSDSWQMEFIYRRTPQLLAADDDEPIMPDKFHALVVYRALRDHAGFDEKNPQYIRAERLYKHLMGKLRLEQLDDYTIVGTR